MIKVIMYTKENCPNCNRADMLFQFCPVEHSIIKKNIDDKNMGKEYSKELKEKDIMSVPSFVINGNWVEGFNEGKIKEELGL